MESPLLPREGPGQPSAQLASSPIVPVCSLCADTEQPHGHIWGQGCDDVFTDEETEVQRGKVTHASPHSMCVTEPSCSDSKTCALNSYAVLPALSRAARFNR